MNSLSRVYDNVNKLKAITLLNTLKFVFREEQKEKPCLTCISICFWPVSVLQPISPGPLVFCIGYIRLSDTIATWNEIKRRKIICLCNKRNDYTKSVLINIAIAGMYSFKMLYPWEGWMVYQLFCWLQEGKGINRERPWLSVWYWTIKGWHEISMVCQLRNNCCDKQMISYWKQIDPFCRFLPRAFHVYKTNYDYPKDLWKIPWWYLI